MSVLWENFFSTVVKMATYVFIRFSFEIFSNFFQILYHYSIWSDEHSDHWRNFFGRLSKLHSTCQKNYEGNNPDEICFLNSFFDLREIFPGAWRYFLASSSELHLKCPMEVLGNFFLQNVFLIFF